MLPCKNIVWVSVARNFNRQPGAEVRVCLNLPDFPLNDILAIRDYDFLILPCRYILRPLRVVNVDLQRDALASGFNVLNDGFDHLRTRLYASVKLIPLLAATLLASISLLRSA